MLAQEKALNGSKAHFVPIVKDCIGDLPAVYEGSIGGACIMEVIPPRLQKDVRMMAGNGNFVDLKRVVRKPSEGGPLLAEVKIDRIVRGEKNPELGHRSDLLGLFPCSLNLFGEFSEKIRGIVRSRGSFGMILDTERRVLLVSQPSHGAIV